MLKKKKLELQKLSADAKTLYAEMDADEAKRTTENREKFNNMIEAGKTLRAEIESLEQLEEINQYIGEPASDEAKNNGLNPAGGDGEFAQRFTRKSVGQMVIESKEYKNADRQKGMHSAVSAGNLVTQIASKALFNSTDANGGFTVRADRETEILDIARQRPLTVLDLITVGQTSVDAVEYILMSSRTNNAAIVPEIDSSRTHVSAGAGISQAMIDADNGNFQTDFAMKPQGNLTFDMKTALVKTIAEWIPASRQILADAPNLRSMIDNELIYMIELLLENQVVAGDGSGNNFTGMLNTSGIQSRVHKVSGRGYTNTDTVADTLRRMATDIALEFYEADGYILNPANTEQLELEKGSDGHYVMIFNPVTMTVWRKPVRETQAVPSGTALCGQFKLAAKLWDREQSNIRVGEPGNFFLQNAVAILAELRAAFAVTRPKAIEKATGLNG